VFAVLDKDNEWHDDFPKSVLQAGFVNAVKDSRRTKTPLSYSAAELVALSKETVVHLADVFDSSYSAASRLPSNPQVTLQGLSDELGRARLRDCVRLRGTFEPEDAGKCAGYNVNQIDLANCLAGGDCMPPFGGQVNMETLSVKPDTSFADIAGSTALPRIQIGEAYDLVSIANKCGDVSSNDTGYCLLKQTLGKDLKGAQTLDCLRAAGSKTDFLAKCATVGLPDDQRQQLECFQANSKNTKALALCHAAPKQFAASATLEAVPFRLPAQAIIFCAPGGRVSWVAQARRSKCCMLRAQSSFSMSIRALSSRK
jgi:hypothetical protein